MVGTQTRFPSLELGLDKTQTAGNCDSGYSCAYVSNISWRSDTTPMPKEVDPASLFDRLFGAGNDKAAAESRAKRAMYRKSILDYVADDAKRLDRQLGHADQQKMDEFETSIREIEKRIVMMQKQEAEQKKPDMARPEGIPGDMTDHMRLMCDLLVLAWQMDITRISTVMVARDGSDRHYRWLNITEGHHTCSHHGGNRPEDRGDSQDRQIPHGAVRVFHREIKVGQGRQWHAAGSLDDHAGQRHQRWRSAQS